MTHTPSFLEQQTSTLHQSLRRRKFFRQALWFVFLILVVLGCVFLFSLVEVFAHASDGVQAIRRAKTEALALHFQSADADLQKAVDAFGQAKRFSPVLSYAKWVPFVGTTLSQTDQLVGAGLDAVHSLQSVSEIGQEVMQLSGVDEAYFAQVAQGTTPRISFSDLSPQTKQLVLNRLQSASSQLDVLSNRLELIQTEVREMASKNTWTPLVSSLQSFDDELTNTQQTLHRASVLTDLVPAFSGTEKTQHFLLLFLNNTELRPAGGFVGNYGVLTVSHGEIQSLKTADVYALDRLVEGKEKEPAPFALAAYNQTPIWYFRDANWSPDFAVSAQKMMQKFQEEFGLIPEAQRTMLPSADTFDGVIAFTPTFAANMLNLTGSITVDGQMFTGDNIADALEYQVESGYAKQGVPEAQRKEVIGELMDAVVARVTQMPLAQWSSLMSIADDAFLQKQLFLYHTDAAIERAIVHAGWSGQTVSHASDVQLVVDANLASLKTDPVVDRTISYSITRNDQGERIGRTIITYQHHGTFDWKTSRYRTYTRLYVPAGSVLIRVTGNLQNDSVKDPTGKPGTPDISSELGMTVFGAFISIEPGKTGTLTFEYKLADSVRQAIANGAYVLDVLKQNGAKDHALTLDLDFGKNVLSATPPEAGTEWGDTHYRVKTVLDQDKEFVIGL